MTPPPVARTVAQLRQAVAGWRAEKPGAIVAVVPTMGALHDGHLSLVRAALDRADRVVVTLFVNPRQFDRAADLAAYPSDEAADRARLAPLGVHLLYAPDAGAMYPAGFATTVSVGGIGEALCGASRPGHFDGVATVVAKLFLQAGADLAFFGEKDFQQLQIVRRMAGDLDLQTEIVACPTVREPDGLALSSRNVRLSPAERQVAPRLASALFDAAERMAAVPTSTRRWRTPAPRSCRLDTRGWTMSSCAPKPIFGRWPASTGRRACWRPPGWAKPG